MSSDPVTEKLLVNMSVHSMAKALICVAKDFQSFAITEPRNLEIWTF